MTSAEKINGQFHVGGSVWVKPEAVGDHVMKLRHLKEWSQGPWGIVEINEDTYAIAPIKLNHLGNEMRDADGNPVVIMREIRRFNIADDVLQPPETPTNQE